MPSDGFAPIQDAVPEESSNGVLSDTSQAHSYSSQHDLKEQSPAVKPQVAAGGGPPDASQMAKLYPKFHSFGVLKTILCTSVGSFYAATDKVIVNLCNIPINKDLGTELATSQWIVLASQIACAGFGPFAGKIGERIGMDMLYKVGFLLVSVLLFICAAMKSVYVLIVLRFFVGVFSASAIAAYTSIQRFYCNPAKLPTVFTTQTICIAFLNIVLPLIGGVINDKVSWRVNFLILGCIPLFTSIMAFVCIPRMPRTKHVSYDLLGLLLFLITIASLILFITSFSMGFPWYGSVLLIVGFVGFLIGFIFLELKRKHPLLPIRLVKSRDSIIYFLNCSIGIGGFASNGYILPYISTIVFGMDSLGSATFIAALTGGMALFNLIFGKLVRRMVSKMLYVLGLGMLSLGIIIEGFSAYFSVSPLLYVALVTAGVGVGLFYTANMAFTFILGKDNLATYSSLHNCFQTVGMAFFCGLTGTLAQALNKLMLDAEHYDGGADPDKLIYARIYGESSGIMLWVMSILCISATIMAGTLHSYASERGNIGFRENNMAHNQADAPIVASNDVELIAVEGFTGAPSFTDVSEEEVFFADEYQIIT